MPFNPQRQIPSLIRRRPWLLCPISGTLLALSFPKPSLFPLAWVGLVPYLFFLIGRPSWKSVVGGHILFSLAFFGGLLYWIPSLPATCGGLPMAAGVPAFLLLILMQGALVLPFPLLTRWAARHSMGSALACAPSFWLLAELVRSRFFFDGFSWGLLGYSQLPFAYLSQAADLGGAFLVSFLTACGSSLAVLRFSNGPLRPQAALGAVLLGALAYGAWRIHVWQPMQTEPMTVALVQPSIERAGSREHYARRHFEALAAFYQQASLLGADWVIFPEAQNPFSFGRDFYYTSFWKRLARTYRTPLLLGSIRQEDDFEQRFFKSAILLDSDGETAYRHDAAEPVPLGGCNPWCSHLSTGVTVGEAGKVRFSALIGCESLLAPLSRQASARGAQVLVHMSDDSCWGGSSAPWQLFQAARMRAIEVRKPVLRAANTGITARIDPWGRAGPRLEMFRQDMLLTEVRGTFERSIYSIIGDWPSLLLVLAGPAASFWGPALRRRISGAPAESRNSGAG